ncbi:MAG TPA: hypothetical protein PKD86_00865 [Gemmatales bacterium]|nr:hypothetical protein [Gemmatales bacterium]HMP57874.1 hypothetical protein [Gemmatales bacterium]
MSTPEEKRRRNLRIWVGRRLVRPDPGAMLPFHNVLDRLWSTWPHLALPDASLAKDQLATLVQVVLAARRPQSVHHTLMSVTPSETLPAGTPLASQHPATP